CGRRAEVAAAPSRRPVSRTNTLVVTDAVCGHTPLGCQTVLVSTNASILPSPGSAVQSTGPAGGRTTRFRFAAAAASSSAANAGSPTPVRSSALTSMWLASQGAVSAGRPVSRFTTPPGRSDVASTSVSVTAGSGRSSLASTPTAFLVTMAGATTLTSPSRVESCGATIPTTPVGSTVHRLKYGPATGLALPSTWASLSDQLAYQTQRSIAVSTVDSAASREPPSAARTSSTYCASLPLS